MSDPSYEDAQLILRLYELRRESTMRDARQWFTSKFRSDSLEDMQKHCPPGSQEHAYFRMVTSYWDMAATFVVEGVLNDRMFSRTSGEAVLVWERVRPVISALRQAFSNPLYLKNLETVAESAIAAMKAEAPGAYESFVSRVVRPE
jgi:hypothetical protein